jgi:hypothetical protein
MISVPGTRPRGGGGRALLPLSVPAAAWTAAAVFVLVLAAAPAGVRAANLTWTGGDGTWNDGAGTANWNPADEPDADDTAIFNTNNAITLGSANVILGLTLSGSAELDMDGNDLTLGGAVSLTGSGTRLEVTGSTAALTAQNITINSGAMLFVDGGTVSAAITGAANATLTTAAGGTLSGNGSVTMTDAFTGVTTAINNNGTLTASNPPAVPLAPPPAGTLSLSASDGDARLDLDGTGSPESGAVNVSRNQTLDINLPLADVFNGSLTMTHNTRLETSSAWILGIGGTVDINNGATTGLGAVAADTATIAGSSFSQNDGTITVEDVDGTLQFDVPFAMNGGDFINNGLVIFNQSATIATAANFTMPGDASLTVEAGRTLTINQTGFNLDGTGLGGTVITVNSQGRLNLNSDDYDTDTATNVFDATITLNSSTFNFNPVDPFDTFTMDGVLNMNNTGSQTASWEGKQISIGNDGGTLDAHLNAAGGVVRFTTEVVFRSDAAVNVAAGATVNFEKLVNFTGVNGANIAEFTGAGRMDFFDAVQVNEATTLNMPGGTVTLDGADGTGNGVSVGAPFTINARTLSSFGNTNPGGGTNSIFVNSLVSPGGMLTVNLDGPLDKWILNVQGTLQLANDSNQAVLLAGNDVIINGTLTISGDVEVTARVDIGATAVVNVTTFGEPLRLAGGTFTNPNTISGGTISGNGRLGSGPVQVLQGFGTINTDIDFPVTATLKATGGTLTLGGNFINLPMFGTADSTGILNVTSPWVTTGGLNGSVELNGGTLQGAQVTNDNITGIRGHGVITARVINNSRVTATGGGVLRLQTPNNDNNWDGTTNTGQLEAITASLELRDNASFPFTGTVSAAGFNEVYANGFALDFNPGSTLQLDGFSFYRCTHTTSLGGNVLVPAGAAGAIQVTNGNFLRFETGGANTLNGDLHLLNNLIIVEAGAVFSGNGKLVCEQQSSMTAGAGANINVLLEMHGTLRPGNLDEIARVDLRDYQQTSNGRLEVEVAGTGISQFDRLVVDGAAQVAGTLHVDIDGGFVPSAGQTFTIITAGSVSGTFSSLIVEGFPSTLSYRVNYLPTAVQVEMIAATPYDVWINSFGIGNAALRAKTADPDRDGLNNLAEFALDGNPVSARNTGKIVGKVGSVSGTPAFTLTFPVRNGAVPDPGDPAGGELRLRQTADTLRYAIQASDNLTAWPLEVTEVSGADAAAIRTGLPALTIGWNYRTFRSPGPVAGDPQEFMRVRITE